MSNTFNSGVYPEEYRAKIQARLQHPTNWKEVCRVEYTDKQILNNPYQSTSQSVAGGTRGTAFSFSDIALTNDTVTINDYDEVGVYIDWADLAQLSFGLKMEMADRNGQLINEDIEAVMLSKHGQWTDFDNASIGGVAGNITVSASNIDDIIRGVKREVREANGQARLAQNGAFVIWRAADFELLEAFMQANGFSEADTALKNGTVEGVKYMGVKHLWSNDHTSGHLFGGVAGLNHLGICRSTYGQPQFIPNPAGSSGGVLSGLGIHNRVDMQFEAWETIKTLLFDILVA